MATCPKCRVRYSDDVETCELDGERLLPDEACSGLDADLAEGDLVGEFRVERKIGEGAFGTVYGAVHPVIGKAAAIKVLRRKFSSDPTVLSRFVAEARAVNQIRHRNIIDIFSFGALPGGRQYFAMEWLDGIPLDQHLKKHGPLAPDQAMTLLRDVGRALAAAHAAGIAHRDLKPDNVFLCSDDAAAVYPKLLDFGIAKLLDSSAAEHKTRTGVAMGTPLYMSPEQCRGRGVDHRADIYSFGAMAHEVLTGRPPFDADNVMELMLKQTTAPPPPMSTVRVELPEQLDAPVLRMLAKDPAERPQTIREAVDELIEAAQAAGLRVANPRGELSFSRQVSGDSEVKPSRAAFTASARSADRSAAPAGRTGTLANVEADVAIPGAPAARHGSRRTGLLVVGAVLIVGWALAVAFVRSRPADESIAAADSGPASQPSATSDGASLPPAAPSAPASSDAEVRLTIHCSVHGIDVLMDGNKIGTAPGQIALPRGTEPVELTLLKPGYLPEKVTVTPDRDGISRSVELRPRPTSPKTRHTAPTTRATTGGNPTELAFPPGFEDSP